jgi:hypothetical protein
MTFRAEIKIIGVNPYVTVPEKLLNKIFKEAGRDKGPIPICGLINSRPYRQTLVKYRGEWRLYINTFMLARSPQRIGETIDISAGFDPADRSIAPHPAFVKALDRNKTAKKVFDELPPSRKKEIVRYISSLKTEESVARNIDRAINFLSGKGRFVGRDKP